MINVLIKKSENKTEQFSKILIYDYDTFLIFSLKAGYSVQQKQFTLADKSFTKIQTHNFDGMNTREKISTSLMQLWLSVLTYKPRKWDRCLRTRLRGRSMEIINGIYQTLSY